MKGKTCTSLRDPLCVLRTNANPNYHSIEYSGNNLFAVIITRKVSYLAMAIPEFFLELLKTFLIDLLVSFRR